MTDTGKAIVLMVIAMATFALADAMIKLAATRVPVAEVLTFICAGGLIIFCIIAKATGVPLYSPSYWNRAIVLRNISEGGATACMAGALALAPLVQVVAITQATPVLVTVFAVLILKETVGSRRWAAICLGLVGVLIVVRPTTDIEVGAMLALGAAIGMALRDVFTRMAPKDVPVIQLSIWGLTVLLPTAAALTLAGRGFVMPGGWDWLIIGVAVISATIAYLCITTSLRLTEVSRVVPFRYSRMLFGTVLGIWIFDERLDLPTVIGSLLVIVAGLYILARERRAPLPRVDQVS